MHSKSKGGKKDGLDLKTFFFFGFREFLKKFSSLDLTARLVNRAIYLGCMGYNDGENIRFTSPAVESFRPGILVNFEKSTSK